MDLHPPDTTRRRALRRKLPVWAPTTLSMLLWSAMRAWAQEDAASITPSAASAQPSFSVTPRVSVSETFTDNINLSGSNRRSEQITEVSPGIRMVKNGGRISGYFDYALRAISYAQSSHDTSYLHALSTGGQADVLNQWLFVDFAGNISQSAVSALGPLSGVGGYNPTNSTEVSRYQIAPFVQGTLASAVDYNARYSRTVTHANTSAASDVGEALASINLSSSNTLSRVGWVADASRYNVDYSAGRATEADQNDIGIRLAITPQLSGVFKVGREYSNYTTLEKRRFDTTDVSLAWQPSTEFQANASWGQRSFGDTHSVNLAYVAPLWALRLSDRRDVSAVPGQLVPVLLLPPHQLANQNNIVPGSVPVIGYFVTTAVAVQDRQELQLSLLGVRDTFTMGYSQSSNSRLDRLSATSDVLANRSLAQQLVSLGYNHKLTPRYDFDVTAAVQRAQAGAGQEDTVLRQVGLNLNAQVARQGSASVGLRHAVSTGGADYHETALTLGLRIEF